ncbi:MAG: sirohydrochlorin chelatase [Nocardioidaceae bacterium]|nr:sirohydrochlorin chelatase [Nocardioidaceae bacterium]
MTAPALLALAHGSRDPRSAATVRALRDQVRALRRDLRVDAAFLELSRPGHAEAFGRLAADGVEEVVVVPMLLTQASHARVDVPSAVADAAARTGMRIQTTPVLGARRSFLDVLDVRLRTTLAESRVRELDALVLAAAGSTDHVANAGVQRVARAWGARHRLPVLTAFASATPPSTGEAVRQFRADGRRHIAVGSFFLAPGFLPDRAAELALEAGAVAVSQPLGADVEVARTVLQRYAVGAVDLVPLPT